MLKALTIAAGAALLLVTPVLACNDISSKTIKLTACVDDDWVAGTGNGAQEFVYTSKDQNFGLMVITESQVFDATTFHDAIITNAVNGVGGKPEDVKTVSERVENIDGKPFSVLEYTAPVSGSQVLFQNFYFSQPGIGSVQILAYSLEPDASAAGFKTGIFASTVKIGE